MKSMQLLWQSSPVADEEDDVLQEKESAQQDCSIDPALAKEYVRALTEEQIPQPLLDKMADLINESIPELVRQSIDKEAEKRNIYNHLLSPFTDYIRFIYEKIQTEGASQWKQDEIRLKEQVKELNDYIRELSSKQEEFQSQYLSAERQKRALGERVHELEMRIVTFEAEKEQNDMEKSALNNKLKVAAVQGKNKADELAALQEEKSRLEQELAKAQQVDLSLPDKLQRATEKAENLQKQLNSVIARQQDADNAFVSLQTENAGLQDELGRMITENNERIRAGYQAGARRSVRIFDVGIFIAFPYFYEDSCSSTVCRNLPGVMERKRRKFRVRVFSVWYPTSRAISRMVLSVRRRSSEARLNRT